MCDPYFPHHSCGGIWRLVGSRSKSHFGVVHVVQLRSCRFLNSSAVVSTVFGISSVSVLFAHPFRRIDVVACHCGVWRMEVLVRHVCVPPPLLLPFTLVCTRRRPLPIRFFCRLKQQAVVCLFCLPLLSGLVFM